MNTSQAESTPSLHPTSTLGDHQSDHLHEEPSEEMTLFLEEQIADLAPAAGKLGFWRPLSSGLPVMCAQDDALWQFLPDGTRRYVKTLEVGADIPVGTRFEIPSRPETS